jgi:hypothetical protein
MSQLKAPFSRSLSLGKAPRVLGITAWTLLMSSFLNAQHVQPGVRRALINEEIDEARLYRLVGNTRPETTAQNDRGAVPGDFPLEHMILQLKRSADDEQLFEGYIDSLTIPPRRISIAGRRLPNLAPASGSSRKIEAKSCSGWNPMASWSIQSRQEP